VHYALNRRLQGRAGGVLDASYFRALAVGSVTGLSARAWRSIRIGRQGEEFPNFVEFWVERPAPGARSLVIMRCSIRPGWPAPIDSRFDLETTPWST